MSRWKSPQLAAKETEKVRREKLKDRLKLIGIILLMLASTTAYVVFYAIPRLTKVHRHNHQRSGGSTNVAPPKMKP